MSSVAGAGGLSPAPKPALSPSQNVQARPSQPRWPVEGLNEWGGGRGKRSVQCIMYVCVMCMYMRFSVCNRIVRTESYTTKSHTHTGLIIQLYASFIPSGVITRDSDLLGGSG